MGPSMTQTAGTSKEPSLFTAEHRCDRCGAQAQHVTSHLHDRSDGNSHITQLLWCDHHYRLHWKALMQVT